MSPEQLEFSENLQKLHPQKAQKISKMLRFIGSVNNPNVWDQFSTELKEALNAHDEKRLQLLEGLMRRMQGMLSEDIKPKPKKKYRWLLALAVIVCLMIYLSIK